MLLRFSIFANRHVHVANFSCSPAIRFALVLILASVAGHAHAIAAITETSLNIGFGAFRVCDNLQETEPFRCQDTILVHPELTLSPGVQISPVSQRTVGGGVVQNLSARTEVDAVQDPDQIDDIVSLRVGATGEAIASPPGPSLAEFSAFADAEFVWTNAGADTIRIAGFMGASGATIFSVDDSSTESASVTFATAYLLNGIPVPGMLDFDQTFEAAGPGGTAQLCQDGTWKDFSEPGCFSAPGSRFFVDLPPGVTIIGAEISLLARAQVGAIAIAEPDSAALLIAGLFAALWCRKLRVRGIAAKRD